MANPHVLILGGRGRIGRSVAQDLIHHTPAEIILTGRQSYEARPIALTADDRIQFLKIDLEDTDELRQAIARSNLVIHCAGPFHYRDARVLHTCIEQGIPYIDVSDNVGFTRRALDYSDLAIRSGVTAVINTGIFPGISNSMVRQCIEQFDQPEEIHLSYVVGGSGGAGLTVMRTTFLGLMAPFKGWINGQWQLIKPYSDRQSIQLPAPYNTVHVYWYEMPETFTLAEAFSVQTVVTKFGSIPDFYNHLTWIAAHIFPKNWIQSKAGTEFLSRVSYAMTRVTDRFSGVGVGIRAEVTGRKDGQSCRYVSTLTHDNTAIAAGYGTGSIAQLLLSGQLQKPGVWAVEAALSTPLFEDTMRQRGVVFQNGWQP